MQTRNVEIVVVGAGIAGLSFARAMRSQGRQVLIVERSRALGGRCATWRHAGIPLDYGVPFLHGRSPLFWQTIDRLMADDVLPGWPERVQGEGPTCQPRALEPGERRAALRGGMNSFAKRLAGDLEILRGAEVASLAMRNGRFELGGEGFRITTRTLVLAASNGQSLRLLKGSELFEATAGATALLGLAPARPSFSLLVCYDTPATRPAWELLLPEDSRAIQLISDESSKSAPQQKLCLCIQARPPWSRARLDSPADEWSQELLRAAQPYLGDWALQPDWQRPHRWREARLDSASRLRQPLLQAIDGCQLGITGEYFHPAGGLEGAFLAGCRLADLLLERQ
jgi:predicted NAD/FAD-dependent oxidoreductase